MSDIIKLLDEIDALEKKATPGDWYWSGGCNWLMSSADETVLSASHDNDFISDVSISSVDADLIKALRNNWPRISNALREAVEIIAVAESTGIEGRYPALVRYSKQWLDNYVREEHERR